MMKFINKMENGSVHKLFKHDLRFLDAAQKASIPTYQVVLNRKLNKSLFMYLNARCTDLVCADGGSNQLFDKFIEYKERESTYVPSAIIGDLDSIRDDVQAFYKSKGTLIKYVNNQDNTDFEKVLDFLH